MKGLLAHFSELSPEDQLGLINDTRILGYAGEAPLSDFLAIASRADPSTNALVLATLAARMRSLGALHDDLPTQAQYRVFGSKLLAPLFARVGWTAKSGEAQNTALLRQALIAALSEFDDPDVIAEARKRFAEYLTDPRTLSGDLRRSVLGVVARHADASTWEHLRKLAQTTTDWLEKQEYYELLGRVEDRALAERTLDLTLTGEAPTTTRPDIIRVVSVRYPDLAFHFAVAHWTAIAQLIEPDERPAYVPAILLTSAADPALITELKAFAAKNIPPTAQQDVQKAEASIADLSNIRRLRLPEVDRWIAQGG